jgi:hypothetical protein
MHEVDCSTARFEASQDSVTKQVQVIDTQPLNSWTRLQALLSARIDFFSHSNSFLFMAGNRTSALNRGQTNTKMTLNLHPTHCRPVSIHRMLTVTMKRSQEIVLVTEQNVEALNNASTLTAL